MHFLNVKFSIFAFITICQGVSLLDAKNQLLLSYLTYLAYYILLKAHGVPIATHPVLERLIETKLLLQKLRPIEAALKPQLQRLLSSAGEGTRRPLFFPCFLSPLCSAL